MVKIPEPFVITQGDENTTLTNTRAGAMSDLATYRVPLGSNILLKPEDVIAVHLLDTTGTVGAPIETTAQVRVELRSPIGGGEAEPVMAATIYETFAPGGVGEFRHTERLVRLHLPAPRVVIEQALIVLQVHSAVIVSAARSWFEIRTHTMAAN